MNASLRIAVADDEPEMRKYFERCLPRLGHVLVGLAQDGKELVALCRAVAPDLVISDMFMPEMDGVAATLQVYQERPVPVILASAYTERELLERGTPTHIAGYLLKPIRLSDLGPAILLAVQRFQEVQSLDRR